MAGPEEIVWRKSSHCDSNACVEVAICDQVVMIRRSIDPDTVLTYSQDEWTAFITGVKAGEMDELPR